MLEQTEAKPSCRIPFEARSGLCATCRAHPRSDGFIACRRLVATSEAMQTVLHHASLIAPSDASCILLGETGTGKEVLARVIHANSTRRDQRFVAVNCAAIPSELLESELFGHAQGAFTGAREKRQGLFEAAEGGTLFLDEVADLPLGLQTKLLRALAEGEVRRVGESNSFFVDVRVICATHQDLRLAVSEGRFREDLFYRVAVFQLQLPPLRERVADIEQLAKMFLEFEHYRAGLTSRALAALMHHAWPGNVRELRNAMKHGAVYAQGECIDVQHLPRDVVQPAAQDATKQLLTLAEIERQHIQRVLAACAGEVGDAARVLGIGRTTLWRKMKGSEGA